MSSMLFQEHGRRAGFNSVDVITIRNVFSKELSSGVAPSLGEIVKRLARHPIEAQQLSPFTAKQIVDKLRTMLKAKQKT